MRHDLARLGQLVRERRTTLDMTQRQAAVLANLSDQTWLNVERGEKVSDRTLARVERALGWGSGSIDAILAGGQPAVPTSEQMLEDRLAALEAELRALKDQLAERHGGPVGGTTRHGGH